MEIKSQKLKSNGEVKIIPWKDISKKIYNLILKRENGAKSIILSQKLNRGKTKVK